MTLVELGNTLDALESGKAAGVALDVYADLFPPGEPDEPARVRCFEFAKLHGCRIDNTIDPERKSIWFVKE